MGLLGSFNDEEGKVNSNAGKYRVMQVVLREKFVGKGSKNFSEIEDICNQQYAEGYRLHTFAQSTAGSTGLGGGDRTVCNLAFEKMELIKNVRRGHPFRMASFCISENPVLDTGMVFLYP